MLLLSYSVMLLTVGLTWVAPGCFARYAVHNAPASATRSGTVFLRTTGAIANPLMLAVTLSVQMRLAIPTPVPGGYLPGVREDLGVRYDVPQVS